MKQEISTIFAHFDQQLAQQAEAMRQTGELPAIPFQQYKIVGQIALLLAELPFDVAATTDIDLLHKAPHAAVTTLEHICLDHGLILETDQHLIWMPEQTTYHPLYRGTYVEAMYADPLYVIASKCKFQRERDRKLLQSYFAAFPEAKTKVDEMGIETAWLE